MEMIDKIMDMLDWNRCADIQERGIWLAQQVESIDVFIQPNNEKYNKNVWDNCAKIVCDKSDQELRPYLMRLLEWVQDLTWPGAVLIGTRLKRYSRDEAFESAMADCIQAAKKARNWAWLENLLDIESDENKRKGI